MSNTNNYAVENKPLPARTYGPSVDTFPFADLEVGQSFFVPNLAAGRAKPLPMAAANEFAKSGGPKFTRRNEANDGVEGVRVYRVA